MPDEEEKISPYIKPKYRDSTGKLVEISDEMVNFLIKDISDNVRPVLIGERFANHFEMEKKTGVSIYTNFRSKNLNRLIDEEKIKGIGLDRHK